MTYQVDDIFKKLQSGQSHIAVVGLGYVGLPLAAALSQKGFKVIGFDTNPAKLELYRKGEDVTQEVGNDTLKLCPIFYSSEPADLKKASFIIVAVPTPVNKNKTPDLRPLISASELVGSNLAKMATVVYESTVYPGATEETCLPLLESRSGLQGGIDFKIGYSPERINPGDKEHRLHNIIKIVAGSDEKALSLIAKVYGSIVEAGIYEAESIKVAEAAKVIENSQRDINIGFMNELSLIFNRMGIDTQAVLRAAGTKWNFLKFSPGLVGGHCIGVDPYYLSYKAEELGYHSQIILAGRRINDDMGVHVANQIVKMLIRNNKNVNGARVAILGLTFKENVGDIRNSKVDDVVRELKEFGINVLTHDAKASSHEVFEEYGYHLNSWDEISDIDLFALMVPHQEYLENSFDFYANRMRGTKLFVDLKSAYQTRIPVGPNVVTWSL